jgi:hypothetical protein
LGRIELGLIEGIVLSGGDHELFDILNTGSYNSFDSIILFFFQFTNKQILLSVYPALD